MAEPPERGDLTDEITRELQRLFPAERMQRIMERLGLEGTEDDAADRFEPRDISAVRGVGKSPD